MEKTNQNMISYEEQETAEMELLNTMTNERIAYETEKVEQEKRIARQKAEEECIARQKEEEKERMASIKAEKAKERRKAYTVKSFVSVAALAVLSGAVCAGGMAEMIHPTIWIPTSAACLCAACVRFGVWFGRVARK